MNMFAWSESYVSVDYQTNSTEKGKENKRIRIVAMQW